MADKELETGKIPDKSGDPKTLDKSGDPKREDSRREDSRRGFDPVAWGAKADVISPGYKLFQDLLHGGGHQFVLSADSGYSGVEIEKHLRRRKIETWGLQMVDGDLLLTVRKDQAAQAQSTLRAAGVTIIGGEVKGEPDRGGGLLRQDTGVASLAMTGGRVRRPQARQIRGRSRLWRLVR